MLPNLKMKTKGKRCLQEFNNHYDYRAKNIHCINHRALLYPDPFSNLCSTQIISRASDNVSITGSGNGLCYLFLIKSSPQWKWKQNERAVCKSWTAHLITKAKIFIVVMIALCYIPIPSRICAVHSTHESDNVSITGSGNGLCHPFPIKSSPRWVRRLYRVDSRFAPSHWETALLCVSHWLGTSLEQALLYKYINRIWRSN